MIKFIVSRLIQSVIVIFCIITMTFFMVRLAPGSPFSQEKNYPPEVLEQMNAYYGLDKHIIVQYFQYMKNLVFHLDLGPSYGKPGFTVSEIIAIKFPVSLQLGFQALLVALLVGIPAGIIASVRKNSVYDYAPMSLAMIGVCLPSIAVGPLLSLYVAIKLGWFEPSGWYGPSYWVLPSITLGLYYAAYLARLSRGGMLEVLSQDYIRTARAKGVAPNKVILKHALRLGIMPVVAFLGPAIAGLVSGSFVVENIFAIPGLGKDFVNAALNRDYGLVLGTVLFFATLIVILNLIVDVIMAILNPKVRL